MVMNQQAIRSQVFPRQMMFLRNQWNLALKNLFDASSFANENSSNRRSRRQTAQPEKP
jgi:hypothetical protein